LISVTPVTVFVGPNNSGKSKVLSEIEQYCRTGQKQSTAVILDELTFTGMALDDTSQTIERLRLPPNPGESILPDHVIIGGRGGRLQVPLPTLTQALQSPGTNPTYFCQWFLTFSTLMLDGRSRISLVNQQPAGDLQQPPQSSLQVLFRDDRKRHEVRRIIAEAFGAYFVIDPTNLGHLRIRLAQHPPDSDMVERGIHQEAVDFHAAAQPIELASDGVKAFTGIITELMAGDPRVVLIDEPEAFLHPSLASKLGYEISRAALASNKRVFVSTHSPSFVMGCIQSGAPLNIVRLTYRDGTATARVLPNEEIQELTRHPLLRSTNVLSGLFYEFIVVTESDADRAFYQEVNERLLRFKPNWGIPNCLFVNAQNKQTIKTIIQPLRKLGIPTAGIVDIDIIKDGSTVWSNLLDAACVPPISRDGLAQMRAGLKQAADRTGRDIKRDGGIAILEPADAESARSLFGQLADYGLFVVSIGELESWLKPLGASGHGPSWLIDMFERMGEDPDSPDYVKPSDDDVWQFLAHVKAWLVDPKRKGIPT
jgi:ABC-type cobalamin/Fe3+-siderophores transport system ATPase subunit